MADIHKSDLDDLRKRVQQRNYSKYLLEMRLVRARALQDQRVRFDFPVTALIGTNGGGKSTVLGAAAIAYKDVRPGEFFPKSNVGDVSMANWRIDYEIVDRSIGNNVVARNARFVAAKWRRDELVSREVIHFPIKRTVPASEQTRYRRFIGIYEAPDPDIRDLSEATRKAAGSILGKDVSKYKIARLKKDDQEYILLGERKADDFSQFHFGAGEASIIQMVADLESCADYSLVTIEEVENGLHPIATEKMVDHLIWVAKEKKLQIIFTTHSEYALRRLPPEAKWAAIEGQLYQGNLNIDSLRALTGSVNKEHVIFVEDEFAKDWVEDILRQFAPGKMPVIEVHSTGGYAFALEVTRHHNLDPSIKTKAVAMVDGDSPTPTPSPENVYKLPGSVPENVIWKYIEENAESLAGLIQQRCMVPQLSQDDIVKCVHQTSIDAGDPHLIFRKLSERLGFLSELIVRRAMISIYNQANKDQLGDVLAVINGIAAT